MAYRVDLFCEDIAHESCARAVIARIAGELDVSVTLQVGSARFGIPRLKRELDAFQALVRRRAGAPELFVVMIDANDIGPAVRRREVEEVLDPAVFPLHVVGTPDPCVERWLLADPTGFAARFGQQPQLGAVQDGREWKRRLVDALERAGQIVTQGGADYAAEIVDAMDIYRAGQADPTFRAFTDDVRAALRQLQLGQT